MTVTEMPTINGTDVDDAPAIRLERLRPSWATFMVVGVTPMIQHAWSEKAIRIMQEAQAGGKKASAKNREPKVPKDEYHAAHYWFDEDAGIAGVPSSAFKKAMVSACRFYDGITMVKAKSLFFVPGENEDQLIPINGTSWMRTDPVKVGQTTDLRYRPQFDRWSCRVSVEFYPTQIDPESVANLLDAAGAGVGIGEWRPEKGGPHGRFAIVDQEKWDAYHDGATPEELGL